MKVQRVQASRQVTADVGRVALRYGPLIYNLESVDQNLNSVLSPKLYSPPNGTQVCLAE